MLNSWFRSLTRSTQIAVPIHIPARKSGTTSRRMEPLFESPPDCRELLVPLAPRLDMPVRPTIAPGDHVGMGQALSEPQDESGIRAFSPAEGVALALTTVDTQHACELPAVRLRVRPMEIASPPGLHGIPGEAFPAPEAEEPVGDRPDLRAVLADIASIEDLPGTLDELGVLTTSAGQVEPMGHLLRRAAGRTNLLVINAIQSEPRLASHLRLAIDATGEIIAGVRGLLAYLNLRHATLLVSAAHNVHTLLARRLRRFRVRTVAVRTSHPGSHDSLVLRRIFQRAVPYAGDGLARGALLLPMDTVWRTGMALMRRMPVLTQPVTVAGDCLLPASQRVYLVPIGLTISGLIEQLARRGFLPREPKVIILGGAMTGTAIVDPARTVITAATQAVLLMCRRPIARTTGCIRCGWCITGCPVSIDPVAILDALEAGQTDRFGRLAVHRCIDCGVCSSICPSHLSLSQAARSAKALLRSAPSPTR